MKIYNPSGEVLIETVVSDRSGLYKSIDNREELTLQFSLDRHVDIPVGSWCNFEGARYEVMSLPDVKMINTKNYSYTVVLASNFSKTAMYIVRNPVDGRIKFDLTAKPIEHMRLIVDNLNQREGGWSVGSCIESVEKLVSYNQVGCDMALVNIADVFETEVEVKGKVISLGKVEYFKDSPLALSYGKGKGFKTGILRTGDNGGLPTHKVFVIGGSRNISLKDYGSKELHLPVELSFGFDGEFFDGEVGYSYLKAKPFVTDKKGSFVMIDDNTTSGKEDCIDLSDVYPSRVGKVTGVVYVYQGKDYETLDPSWTEEQLNEVQVDFIDDTIPDNLDYNECLIENGEPLTVIFQTGMLAGREFSATYVSDKKRFELQKQEFDGLPMPQGAFIPSVPDSYAVFNVSMPSTYISDPSTYSGAEFDILREASRVLYESSSLKFSFTGELDGIWAKKNWEIVSPRIRIGSYVSFVHEKMFPDEPAVVRIVGITQYVNNPHSPKIEISNSIGSSSLSSRISALENNGAHVEELFEESKRYTKRRFSDVKHTIEMLAGAFENFSDGIDPVTVETMLAAIGDESLQYVFTKSLESDDPADFSYSYDEKTKVFSVPDAFIKHMTLGIDSISPVHSEDEYMRWAVSGVTSEALADKDKGYYLYAVVKKNSTTGEFKLLESPVMLEEVDGYYHLLVGILNKEFADSRSFACLFGFTEILPGQIVTESIRSSDGKTWLDLLRGILHLNDMAGVSGVKTDSKGDQSIAAWFGGLMQDKELDDDATNPAKSVIRHDGTGYFADGLFKWDKDHGVNLGNDSIKINYDGSVEFGPNIKISTEGDETLGSVLTLIAELKDMFYKYDDNTIGTKYSFFSEKQSAAGGVGVPDSGGGEAGLLLTSWPTDGGDYSSYALGGNLGVELNKRLTVVERGGGGGGAGITVDSFMSDTSQNPVENRIVKSYIDTENQKQSYFTVLSESEDVDIPGGTGGGSTTGGSPVGAVRLRVVNNVLYVESKADLSGATVKFARALKKQRNRYDQERVVKSHAWRIFNGYDTISARIPIAPITGDFSLERHPYGEQEEWYDAAYPYRYRVLVSLADEGMGYMDATTLLEAFSHFINGYYHIHTGHGGKMHAKVKMAVIINGVFLPFRLTLTYQENEQTWALSPI